MELVDRVAEAVLYEGYLLYPYRRSAMKNQQRWQFGGVYPEQYSQVTGGTDPWTMQTECLVRGDDTTTVEIRLRFLQVVDRRVRQMVTGVLAPVESLRIGEEVYQEWEEAIERSHLVTGPEGGVALRLSDLLFGGQSQPIEIPAGAAEEPLLDAAGVVQGALVREWQGVRGVIDLKAKLVIEGEDVHPRARHLYRLTVQIRNTTPWNLTAGEVDPSLGARASRSHWRASARNDRPDAQGSHAHRPDRPLETPTRASETLALPGTASAEPHPRHAPVRQAFISTHTILRVRNGEFISLLEPPPLYADAAESCRNIGTWPVLVGEPGERHTILSSPIILYDYPEIAPESPGSFFDATEIDELLALSVLTLSNEEKREMRETDPRAREILQRTEALTSEELAGLHGAVRGWQVLRREE